MTMAIITEYHGPTNSKGGRVKATARKRETWGDRTMPEMAHTESWDHAHNIDRNHTTAAALCSIKFGWGGVYVAGALSGGGFAFVNIGGRDVYAVRAMKAQLEGEFKRDGFDYFANCRRYTLQPETSDGGACDPDSAERWTVYDTEDERELETFPSRAKAEARRIALETFYTMGHWPE